MPDALDLACELIARPSITPQDEGCQALLGQRLRAAGFEVEYLTYGEVDNLWAYHGTGRPVLAFAGHTDVVPAGPLEQWSRDPFQPTVDAGQLYGRGAADMKSSLAAMLVAAERFVRDRPNHGGCLAFLITSDEEGVAQDGTRRVMEYLAAQRVQIDHCIVGEPSSRLRTADVIRNGRRGSLNADLTVIGVQGHIAYPEALRNPIHVLARVLAELSSVEWDRGNDYFPPTTFQVSNLTAGTGADNVVPGQAVARFNFRFNTEQTVAGLEASVETLLQRHGADYEIEWRPSGAPFLTPIGELTEAVRLAVIAAVGYEPELSTSGGTSDGRFIAPTGAGVIEVGPVNATIHQIDECIAVEEISALVGIYEGIMARLLP